MSSYIHDDCGLTGPSGWLNFDASPRLRIERARVIGWAMQRCSRQAFSDNVCYGDIVSGLPVVPGGAAGLCCSHVLEHIDRASVERALANSLTLLRPGGIFGVVIPDLEARARQYLNDLAAAQPYASDRFLLGCYLGEEARPSGIGGWALAILGNSRHRWMYDQIQFRQMLAKAGFAGIRDCEFGDCSDPRFAELRLSTGFLMVASRRSPLRPAGREPKTATHVGGKQGEVPGLPQRTMPPRITRRSHRNARAGKAGSPAHD